MKPFRDLLAFFAKVPGSARGILVPEELYRSIVTSLGSGGLAGFAMTVAQAMLLNVAGIFPDPTVAGLATVILTLIVDLIRRLSHGPAAAVVSVPVPVSVPIPVPAPPPAPTP